MLLRIMGRKKLQTRKMEKRLGTFTLEGKRSLEEEKKEIQRAQEREKKLRIKWSCFREDHLFDNTKTTCLFDNQRQHVEENQLRGRLGGEEGQK